jgi:hypothetical protein
LTNPKGNDEPLKATQAETKRTIINMCHNFGLIGVSLLTLASANSPALGAVDEDVNTPDRVNSVCILFLENQSARPDSPALRITSSVIDPLMTDSGTATRLQWPAWHRVGRLNMWLTVPDALLGTVLRQRIRSGGSLVLRLGRNAGGIEIMFGGKRASRNASRRAGCGPSAVFLEDQSSV